MASSAVVTNPRARLSRTAHANDVVNPVNVICYRSNKTVSFNPSPTHSRLVCLDSGASHDLWNCRDDFAVYSDISGTGRFVTLADDSKVPIMGVGTVQIRLAGKVIRLNDVFHVPRLDMCLLSIRVHRRRGDGCSFIADSSGCFYTFPTFTIEVNDDTDVTLPFSSCSSSSIPDFSDPHHSSAYLASVALRRAYLGASVFGRRVSSSLHSNTTSAISTPLPGQAVAQAESVAIPSRYVPCSGGPKSLKLTGPQLHEYFGSRRLNYNILPHLGTGLEVPLSEDTRLAVGDVVNIKRTRCGGELAHSPIANHTVGADIGYGDGTSPGGYKYCLFLTCLGTKATFAYGLRDTKGETLCDAFWMYAIEAGGFPKRLRCDFDKRFIQGAVARLLRSHGVRIGASPPHRQSQNGAVERQWQTACNMARSFLVTARLPKRYWFWAIREATTRMNLLPVKRGDSDDKGDFQVIEDSTEPPPTDPVARLTMSNSPPSDDSKPSPPPVAPKRQRHRSKHLRLQDAATRLTTPYILFFGKTPDYRILFRFGCIGYYRKPFLSSGQKTSGFHEQTHPGIVLGRSDYSNALMFWDPTTSKFSVSSDYKLDTDWSLPDAFPDLHYDGSFRSGKLSGHTTPKEPFPPGSPVYALIQNEFHSGVVIGVPTDTKPWYVLRSDDGKDTFTANPMDVSSPDDPLFPVDRYRTDFDPLLPSWIHNTGKVTLNVDGSLRQGYLSLSDDILWSFVQRDLRGDVVYRYPLHDLPHTWRSRLLDGSLAEGWGDSSSARANKVTARNLVNPSVPSSFRQSMKPSFPDHSHWKNSYKEEYDSLISQQTYKVISLEHYRKHYSNIKLIPTMCVQTIKYDEHGEPDRVKSRIVALGNHEDDIWSKSDRYAPVIGQSNHRLLTNIAVEKGRKQKQGDCKNAFLHPWLPRTETTICRPPPGCPYSEPTDLWLLQKTIYGLRRSPHHWFKYITDALKRLGLQPLPNDPCIYTGTLIP